jgi:L-alanine-DL-glutamate epimerase-like enolase superfamily enzyme
MKLTIASVEAIPLAATWDRVFGGWDRVPPSLLTPASSHRTLPRRGQFTTLVRIRTVDGLEGIGEAYGLPAPEVPAAVVNGILAQLVIGQDAMATEAIWETLYASQEAAGRTGGFYLEAISGIDMALWDLRGKALGLPVHRLLGGPVRERIRCYASPVPFLDSPEESAAKAREFTGQGFGAIKLKLGRGIDVDLAHTAAVRDAIGPDVDLLVDLNCAYGVKTAIRLGRELERLRVFWLEEPLATDDLDGLAEVRAAVALPVATGESAFTAFAVRDALLKRAIDFAMPNPARAGGITGLWRIAQLCRTFHVAVSPHGVGSGINIAAALHIAAAASNCPIYEYNQLLNPLRHGLLTAETAPRFADGQLAVPDRPGLGIELNEDAVREFTLTS